VTHGIVAHAAATLDAVPVACTLSDPSPIVTLSAANAPEAKKHAVATTIIIAPSLTNGFLENI
jgi:hypothetical protein